MKYKALSVRQPWAHAITWAGKTLEVRSRPIKYRGDVLICSSATKSMLHDTSYFPIPQYTKEDFDDYEKCTGHKIEFGKALCLATITDCVPMSGIDPDTEWDQRADAFMLGWEASELEGQYGWRLENIRPIEPFPVKGQLNLFSVECDELKFIELDEGQEARLPIIAHEDDPESMILWGGLAPITQCAGCVYSLLEWKEVFPDVPAYITSDQKKREKVFKKICDGDYKTQIHATTCPVLPGGIKPRNYMYRFGPDCPEVVSFMPNENVLRMEFDDEEYDDE